MTGASIGTTLELRASSLRDVRGRVRWDADGYATSCEIMSSRTWRPTV